MQRRPNNPRGFEKSVGTCPTTGKAMFVTRKIAKRTESRYRAGTSVYKCLDCDYFHLGHQGDHDRQWHRDHHSTGKDQP